MQQSEPNKLTYLECDKGGYHYGEVLNMVCTQQSCLQDLICCCACIEQKHKKHITKPLKMVIREAKQYSDKLKPAKIDLDVVLNIVNQNKKETFNAYANYKAVILENLSNIQKSLNGYFSYISEQVKLKSSDPKEQLNKVLKVIYEDSTKTVDALKQAVVRLASMIPTNDQEIPDLNQQDIVDSIKTSNEEIGNLVSKNIEGITKKLSECNQSLTFEINSKNMWANSTKYKFSSTLKHYDVKLISDLCVKSQNTSGYKFAIMEPHLQKGSKIKKFAFRIKQTSSNWVAVGMCHSKVVASKSYAFNFSALGHGGYMVSSNGGSWSNTKAEANNTVKAFKFTKGDIIRCIANFQTSKLLFKKKNETYELTFSKIQGDQLHPCALFYYVNDEVEFLPKHKQF